MSEPIDHDSGSRDRATVALVNSKIDTVLAKVEGNAQTTEAHFETIKTRLDGLADIPAQIAAVDRRVTSRLDTHDHKITALEGVVSEFQRGRVYRTTTLPPILIGVASLAVAIIAVVIASH